MPDIDPYILARAQFAANISFHILFPSITMGLAWILLFFRLRFTTSGDKHWEHAYHFWVKIFALSFAIGVVSGITMSFQFGTNWPGFMERTGNISGPLLGYEVLTAFFLEATFLGVMLFGKNRVSNKVHLLACALVAVGTSLSAFWILSLNSWMQTPTGYTIENGVFYVDSWTAVIFNPSFPYRLAHMMTATMLTAAFLVMGVSAWRMKQKVDGPGTAKIFKAMAVMAMIFAPLQVVIGDLHGLNTLAHQPAKIAAIEGVWETERGVPFTVFGFPDEDTRTTRFALEIPYAASWILTHDINGEVRGLNEFEGEHPPVAIVFWSFRVMVGIGMLMILVSWWAGWELFKRKQKPSTWLLNAASWMTFSGWVAVLAGWYVTEIGRQPWIVHGLLTSAEVVADHSSGIMLSTFTGYMALYVFILVSYIATLRYMATKPAASLLAMDQVPGQATHQQPAKGA
ncbi:cytochrome ubiquinol oxidase subunit I [Pseudohongiella sp.]|uniref:Cytochrome ubiquinol oxidase subunit I n=1 Tax=marine sediment metagenome TaxID=412755 RepID=A0A0F9W0N2_9ZZZZ|nr:cytochrome ubiquinol oxidase subunit I [Pseudohongiella sp.]HDZ08363.1 cytochrome ubiquinol oxidase subunit I [Pseudohongiella sp.]HEA61916.1 cytochrome ubiquinol oxidase subunit I [Pseudohongiella sp.]